MPIAADRAAINNKRFMELSFFWGRVLRRVQNQTAASPPVSDSDFSRLDRRKMGGVKMAGVSAPGGRGHSEAAVRLSKRQPRTIKRRRRRRARRHGSVMPVRPVQETIVSEFGEGLFQTNGLE